MGTQVVLVSCQRSRRPAWQISNRGLRLTSKGLMHPHQFLRSPKWRSGVTWPSMYLAGIRVWLFTDSAPSQRTYPASICCWSRKLASLTTPGSRTSIAYSMTRASTRSASTSASAVFMATLERTCWRSTDLSAEGFARPQSGWRCRRRGSSPSRIKQLPAPFIIYADWGSHHQD